MPARRWLAVTAAAVFLATPSLVGPAQASAPAGNRAEAEQFPGWDGNYYPKSPLVHDGRPRTKHLYVGWDFDDACFHRSLFDQGLGQLAELARMIRKSGRKVVWTVGPNKATALPQALDLSSLPHGRCDRLGLEHQRNALDGVKDSTYLPLRKRLTNAGLTAYWRTDQHWNTVGGAVFARALATKLEPRLGRLQQYRNTTRKYYGNLNWFRNDPTVERGPAKLPTNFVTVRTTHKSHTMFERFPGFVKWTTSPARKTWPGKTTIVGDSFTSFVLPVLKPIFRRGQFAWIGALKDEELAWEIADSDTVVLSPVQYYLSQMQTWATEFKPILAQALAAAPQRQAPAGH